MGSPLNSATFNVRAMEGLENYHKAKKTICFLTISQAWGDNTDILSRFKELNRRVIKITTRKYIPVIDYIGVRIIQLDLEKEVSRQHMHIFWKKPYLDFNILKDSWEKVLGSTDQPMTCKTVTMNFQSIERVVTYCLMQSEEHYTGNVMYVCSENWGKVKIKSKRHTSTLTWMQKARKKARAAELRDDI